MAILEYKPGAAFPGVIGRTAEESAPAWPAPVRAREGAPNVVFIVLDDTGFGQLGCYGSPIQTPSFDALAANGLRYSNMHTTALCSPSRSCIITGRNHHSNAMAAITELASGYPGYNGVIPFENGFLSEMLVEHGYSTFMVGKYHLTPSNQETGAGPFDRWPLGRGFQRFYGFLGGDTSQWYPDLVYDNHQVEPPRTRRTTSRRSGRTGTQASLTRAGTRTGSRCSPGRRNSASPRRARSCRGMIRTCPTGGRCRRRRGACTAGSWRCSPVSLATPITRSGGWSSSCASREIWTTR